jgi:hypothetical protein
VSELALPPLLPKSAADKGPSDTKEHIMASMQTRTSFALTAAAAAVLGLSLSGCGWRW